MTINPEDTPLADDVPTADAAEQSQPVDVAPKTPDSTPNISPTCCSAMPTRPI